MIDWLGEEIFFFFFIVLIRRILESHDNNFIRYSNKIFGAWNNKDSTNLSIEEKNNKFNYVKLKDRKDLRSAFSFVFVEIVVILWRGFILRNSIFQ